jgi:hypothetical protein
VTWLLEGAHPSSSKSASEPQELSCSPCLPFKYSFLGCAPLFSYRDSKGHHHEPSHPLGVSHPFTNPCVQMNHHAPSWTQSPKRIIMPPSQTQSPKQTHALINHHAPWDRHTQPWCTPHVDTPNLLVTSYLGSPLAHSHAQGIHFPNLGVRATPSFHLLEDLGEGLHAPSSRRPYILPHLKSFSSPTTSTKYVISKSPPNSCLHCN